VVLLKLAVFVATCVGLGLVLSRRPEPPTDGSEWAGVTVAHRGGRAFGCENTLSAIRRAVREQGARAVEIDIQLTKDGEPVVIHNVRLDTVTDGSGLISELTYAEIEQARYLLSPQFPEGEETDCLGEQHRIPRLEEVVELALELDVLLLLDIKEHIQIPATATMLIELYEKYDLYDKAIVGSFNPLLLWLTRADPRVSTLLFVFPRDGVKVLCDNLYVLPMKLPGWVCGVHWALDPLLNLLADFAPLHIGSTLTGHHWLDTVDVAEDGSIAIRDNPKPGSNVYVVNNPEVRSQFVAQGRMVMSDCVSEGSACWADILDPIVAAHLNHSHVLGPLGLTAPPKGYLH
jgi:hypothetical protein